MCVCYVVMYIVGQSCRCVASQTFLRADRWENHRGIGHVGAFRGDGGQQPATPLSDFWPLMWCHSPSRSLSVWPGSSLGKGLRIKGPEMPSQYRISANEHFVMIFVLNWGFYICADLQYFSISASRRNSRLFTERLSYSSLCLSFSVAALDLFTPPTSPFFYQFLGEIVTAV